jgi:hypothetical protein
MSDSERNRQFDAPGPSNQSSDVSLRFLSTTHQAEDFLPNRTGRRNATSRSVGLLKPAVGADSTLLGYSLRPVPEAQVEMRIDYGGR